MQGPDEGGSMPDFDSQVALELAIIDQVTIILGRAELLSRHVAEDLFLKDSLAAIRGAAQRLAGLVAQMVERRQKGQQQ